jgi:hypothetical protein
MAKRITISPDQFVEKHARNLSNSTQDIRAGVEAVDKCPSHLTDQQLMKMRNNFNESMDSGKTKRRMHSVTLETWKRNTIEIGIARIPAGIAKAKDKMLAFAGELLSYEQEGLSKLESMPKVTLDDSINRMGTWVRHMANFKRKG